MNRFLSALPSVVLIGLLTPLIHGFAAAADRQYLGVREGVEYYYDRESASYLARDLVRVSERWVYFEGAKIDYVGERSRLGLGTAGYEDFAYALVLREINCFSRDEKIISRADYTGTGKTLSSGYCPTGTSAPRPIKRDSLEEDLLRAVCLLR